MRRLIWLDSVRGIAALLVVLEHFCSVWLPSYSHFAQTQVHIGGGAVIAFLLVSGYVIPLTLEGRGSLAVFWRSRLLRLFPIYLVVFAITLATLHMRTHDVPTTSGPLYYGANLVMIQGWFGFPSIVGVAWSLSVEMAFYVVMSLLFWRGLHKHTLALATIAVAAVAAYGFIPNADPSMLVFYMTPFVGVAFFRFHQNRLSAKALGALVGVMMAVLAALWATGHNPSNMAGAFCGYLLFGIFFVVPFLASAKLKLMAEIGVISYSIYLVHPLIVDTSSIVARHVRALQSFGASAAYVLAATVGVSILTYRYIESPFNRIAKRKAALTKPVVLLEGHDEAPVERDLASTKEG
jgi:peptidoglycan/LPS O-acetylase OafA/YrhL